MINDVHIGNSRQSQQQIVEDADDRNLDRLFGHDVHTSLERTLVRKVAGDGSANTGLCSAERRVAAHMAADDVDART